MLTIQTLQVPFSTTEVALAQREYFFTYRFNTRDNLFRLDIEDSDNNPVVNGLVLSENYIGLLKPYYLPEFDHGDLFVVKINESAGPLSLTNLGIDQDYELIYLNNFEIEFHENQGVIPKL